MQVADLRLSVAFSLILLCVPLAQAQVHPPNSTTSKTAYCIQNYQVVPNKDVEVTNGYFLNEHSHDDASHPFSSIVPTSGNTGSTGLPVTVTTTQVGQTEYMDVCCDVDCYRDNWFVGYGDLVSFGQGAFWVLIGATTAHPDNHWEPTAQSTG